MSQPPYPPPGGSDPAGQQPGGQGWGQQPGQGAPSEEPTQQIGQPAPPTQQFQPGQFGQPGEQRDQTAQFGQPEYGQPQPQYGQPQPEYGQPQYGQPQYGQPQYGQPQYGQPQYGGPGGPGGPPPGYGPGPGGSSGGGSGKLIAIIVAIVVVLAGAGVGLFFLLKDDGDDNNTASSTTSASAPTSETDDPTSSPRPSSGDCESPSGNGSSGVPDPDDPCEITEADPDGQYTSYAVDCADEDWQSCDDLYWSADIGSEWEAYGSTCGGRNEETEGGCVDRYEGGDTSTDTPDTPSADLPAAGPAPTNVPEGLDTFVDACEQGQMFGCDTLRGAEGEAGFEEIYQYGITCGGRNGPSTDQYCLELYPGN